MARLPDLRLNLALAALLAALAFASLMVGPAPLKTFAQGLAIGMGTLALVVSAIWAAGGLRATGWGLAWQSPQSLLQVALLLPGFMLQSSVEEVMFRGWSLTESPMSRVCRQRSASAPLARRPPRR